MSQTIRRSVTGGLVMALAALLILMVSGPTRITAAQSAPTSTPNTITVTGQGQAAGQPDVANVQLGVTVTDADPGKALSQASDAIAAITKAVIAAGVAQDDIQTNGVNLYSQNSQPQPDASGTDAAKPSYQAQVNLSVRVRGDVTKAGSVIDAAVKAGANNVYGVSYGIANPGKLETIARTQAVSDAKDRAQQLATALGLKLGSPISSVEEPSSTGPVPLANAMVASGNGVPISAGQLTVGLQVTVTFSVSQ